MWGFLCIFLSSYKSSKTLIFGFHFVWTVTGLTFVISWKLFIMSDIGRSEACLRLVNFSFLSVQEHEHCTNKGSISSKVIRLLFGYLCFDISWTLKDALKRLGLLNKQHSSYTIVLRHEISMCKGDCRLTPEFRHF